MARTGVRQSVTGQKPPLSLTMITVRMPKDLIQALDEYAYNHGRISRSDAIRAILLDKLAVG